MATKQVKCVYCENKAVDELMGDSVCSNHLKKVNSQIDRALKDMGINPKEKK